MANENTENKNTPENNEPQNPQTPVSPKLNTLRGWQERVDSLTAFITAMGNCTLKDFAVSGVLKSGTAQALGILLHQSAGYCGDKLRDKTGADREEAVQKLIAPALTPEQVKAENLQNAKNLINELKTAKVADSVIYKAVANMPEGKNALSEAGIKQA